MLDLFNRWRGKRQPYDLVEAVIGQHERQVPIAPLQGAHMLVAWMHELAKKSPERTARTLHGWFDRDEISQFWAMCCEIKGIEPCDDAHLFDALRSVPGVRFRGRQRIKGDPQYARLRCRMETRAANRGEKPKERAAIYWIPEAIPDAIRLPTETSPIDDRESRKITGSEMGGNSGANRPAEFAGVPGRRARTIAEASGRRAA